MEKKLKEAWSTFAITSLIISAAYTNGWLVVTSDGILSYMNLLPGVLGFIAVHCLTTKKLRIKPIPHILLLIFGGTMLICLLGGIIVASSNYVWWIMVIFSSMVCAAAISSLPKIESKKVKSNDSQTQTG